MKSQSIAESLEAKWKELFQKNYASRDAISLHPYLYGCAMVDLERILAVLTPAQIKALNLQ